MVIGQAENTQSKTSTRWVLTALHEHFHQLQESRPRYYADVDALGLAKGDTTGMWMLNYPFPYTKAEVKEQFAATAKALGQAVRSAQVSYDSNKLGLEVGVRTNLDVLNQQQQLFQTRFNLAQAYYNFLINALRLKQSVGALTDEDVERINRDLGG